MKKYSNSTTWILIVSFTLLISLSAFASERRDKNRKGKPSDQNKHQSIAPLFIYKPPKRGKPGNRVGGGTRGQGGNIPPLAALVPDHTGLTTKNQPSLYWFLAKPTTNRIEFTISNEQIINPLLEIRLTNPDRKGIQCIHLSDYGLKLLPGIEYQWFVALVPDPDSRSKDIVAGGTIKRITPSKTLTQRLTKSGMMEIPGIYADEGIWYDALSGICELIKTHPHDKNLPLQRASLLEQVGLPEVSSYVEKRP
jgi:hypothetical protein